VSRHRVVGLGVALYSIACLPPQRLNSSCRWENDTVTLAAGDAGARRAHLVEDVRVAEEAGIRYADSVAGGMVTERYLRLRDSCTEASILEVLRRHGASRAEVAAVTGARDLWVDLLAVFVPMTALFLAASWVVIGRILAGYDSEDRWLAAAVLAALTPIAAGVGMAATQLWSWLVEMARFRNAHISYRAARLPVSAAQHGWLLWVAAMVLFAAVAIAVMALRRDVKPRRRPWSP